MNLVFLNSIPWAAGLAALAASAVIDLKERRIPNQLVLVVAGSGLVLALMFRPDPLWTSLLVAGLLIVVLGALGHGGILGFGDVKLIAAASLLVGPGHVAGLLVAIALAGGVLSVVYLGGYFALRQLPVRAAGVARRGVLRRLVRIERARIAAGRSVPYGVAICGGVATFAAGEALQWFSAMS